MVSEFGLRLHPHASRYFSICNFFFPDAASIHAQPVTSKTNKDIFESALQSEKKKKSATPDIQTVAKVFKNKFNQVVEKSSGLILCLFGFVRAMKI